MSRKIVIVGSYSVGFFFNGQQIPKSGETVTADSFFETFGGRGNLTEDRELHVPTVPVEAVDTTGAGDVFSGSLMKGLAEGRPLEQAVLYASCAASLSVMKQGVTESVPEEEVEKLFRHRRTTGL